MIRWEEPPEGEPPERRQAGGPDWPLSGPPPGPDHWDSAGRHWVRAEADDRWWIEADGLWYPSFPETMPGGDP